MPILDQWKLELSVDEVLRAQGADPDVIRLRRPGLIKSTEEAIQRGSPLLKPRVLYEQYKVKNFTHERLELVPRSSIPGKYNLSGPIIAQHLSRADTVVLMVCTIGSEIDDAVSKLFQTEPLLALALDGFGSAAVEMLAIIACNIFEEQAKASGLHTSIPLNPGMIGWSVEMGQSQIFSLLDGEEIQVSLTDSWMMLPNKSLSQIIGIGPDLSSEGSSCEYCSIQDICKYKSHYAK